MRRSRNSHPESLLQRVVRQRNAPIRALESQLAAILDGLNAASVLENVQKRPPAGLLCFGPQIVRGGMWLGVVVWYRPPGYYNYQTINLLGVWAVQNSESVTIIVGTRVLNFQLGFYNAESYFRHIRSTFETYYGKDAPPPDEANRLLTVDFDPTRRLDLRREVEAAVARWTQTL